MVGHILAGWMIGPCCFLGLCTRHRFWKSSPEQAFQPCSVVLYRSGMLALSSLQAFQVFKRPGSQFYFKFKGHPFWTCLALEWGKTTEKTNSLFLCKHDCMRVFAVCVFFFFGFSGFHAWAWDQIQPFLHAIVFWIEIFEQDDARTDPLTPLWVYLRLCFSSYKFSHWLGYPIVESLRRLCNFIAAPSRTPFV